MSFFRKVYTEMTILVFIVGEIRESIIYRRRYYQMQKLEIL